ncbi:GTPase Era, partial [Candidatus Omnitrophota bacterium]
PEEQLTDRNTEFLIQEIVREKILNATYEEVPHSVAVVVEEMTEEESGGLLKIYATVFVERTSQKSIIIGKNGAMMKKIGELSRADIEELLSRHVYLCLWVKVREKWKKDPSALKEMGYTD